MISPLGQVKKSIYQAICHQNLEYWIHILQKVGFFNIKIVS